MIFMPIYNTIKVEVGSSRNEKVMQKENEWGR